MLLGESPTTENGNPVENHSSTLRPFCAEVKRAICSKAERVVEMRVSREKLSDSRSKRSTRQAIPSKMLGLLPPAASGGGGPGSGPLLVGPPVACAGKLT